MLAIELFAGAGGLGIGLSNAGFKPVEIVERDRWCCDTIRRNRKLADSVIARWPDPIQADIQRQSFHHWAGKVALVSGGPPCQPFSVGGRHRANADSRDMWSESVRVVREVKPQAFVFENVKGLTRSTFATYVQYIERQLEYPEIEIGYDEVWIDHLHRLEQHHTSRKSDDGLRYRVIYEVLNAADYGVPQKRERVVFVGIRSDLDLSWSFPKPTHSLDSLIWDQGRSMSYWDKHQVPRALRHLDTRLAKRAERMAERPIEDAWSTVRDALTGIADPERCPQAAQEISDHRFQGGARSYPGHTGSRLDSPAKTLKAGVHGVPGGENMLVREDGSVRYFSVRESALLQTFPRNYRFEGSWSEVMRQLGNAVPTLLAEKVGRRLYAELERLDHAIQPSGEAESC